VTLGRIARLAPLAAFLTAGCFATRNDVRLLQLDIARLQAATAAASAQALAEAQKDRAEAARRDSVRAAEVRELAVLLGIAMDSLQSLGHQFSAFRVGASENLLALGQTLLEVRTAQGLNQRRLAELQQGLADRTEALRSPTGTPSDSAAQPAGPMPGTMYQQAFGRIGTAPTTARSIFTDLIAKYPDSPLVPRALLGIAETYVVDSDAASADSVWTVIVTMYPKSPEAPTALYKRGFALARAGQSRKARELFEQIIREYPQASDEVTLARTKLAELPPGG
jgi:TolA-binding protein